MSQQAIHLSFDERHVCKMAESLNTKIDCENILRLRKILKTNNMNKENQLKRKIDINTLKIMWFSNSLPPQMIKKQILLTNLEEYRYGVEALSHNLNLKYTQIILSHKYKG